MECTTQLSRDIRLPKYPPTRCMLLEVRTTRRRKHTHGNAKPAAPDPIFPARATTLLTGNPVISINYFNGGELFGTGMKVPAKLHKH